jgi:hypothetical protein
MPAGAQPWLLFSEVKVNPPGTNDAGSEFIELSGFPGVVLSNVLVLGINGNNDSDPGVVTYVLGLDGQVLGANGLLLITPTNSPYSASPDTTVVQDAQLNQPGGVFGNGTLSLFVLTTGSLVRVGDDLDKGDNGMLEGLPADATVQDSIGWSDGGKDDQVYALATLELDSAAPDAAVRFPGRIMPNDAVAWFYGELLAPDPLTLEFDPRVVSPAFPAWTVLTPGRVNNTAPRVALAEPVSGVIGDAGNPALFFQVDDAEVSSAALTVSAASSNSAVVPSTNLQLTAISPGKWKLALDPIGVGYSDIVLMASDGSVTGRVSVPYAASAPGRAGTVWFIGASDGSTAVPVDPDYVLLGDDENQILRAYQKSVSGLAVEQFDMTPFLGLPDIDSGMPREVDIEASTRVGNRLYWMGSHGHSAEGETRTNRTRIFATDLVAGSSPPVLVYAGRYDYLKTDLIEWDSMNMHGKGSNYYGLAASDADNVPPKAPDGSGLAIEGLSMMRGSTTGAYIGFRAPIVPAHDRNFALIVPILNFADVVDNQRAAGSCRFGPPIELDLYGRGIRSIEGSAQGFMVIGGPAAGSTGPYPADFRLYTWSGLAGEHAQQRTADLNGLNPEGLVGLPPGAWAPGTEVTVLSDSGVTLFYGDDVQAKHLAIRNFKKCRTDVVQLGAAVKPAPLITGATMSGDKLRLRWRALGGEGYVVEARREGEARWRQVGSVIAPGPYAEAWVGLAAPWELFRVRVAAP